MGLQKSAIQEANIETDTMVSGPKWPNGPIKKNGDLPVTTFFFFFNFVSIWKYAANLQENTYNEVRFSV